MKHPNAIFILTLILIFAACGGKPPNDGKTHIKLVHFYMDQRESWKDDVAREFEKVNLNIVVDVEAIPFGLYTSKIQTAAASGSALGDVVLIDDWFGQELFKRGYTVPLDRFVARDLDTSQFYTKFFTVWRKGNRASGELMAMPACGGVTALFYNKDMFDAADVGYPNANWTYDSLRAAAHEIIASTKAGTSPPSGLLIDDGISTGIDTYIYSNGGAILTPDLSRSALLEPASLAAFRSYRDLVQKDKISPVPDPSQSMQQRFLRGKSAMMLSFDIAKQQLKNASFRWDLCAPPKGSAGLQDRQNGQAFGIAKKSEHPEEAWKLIKYIVTLPAKKGVNALFNTAMPLYKPLAHSPEWLNGEPKCNRTALLEITEGKVFTLITPGWQEWRDHAFIPNIQDMLAGRATVEEALKKASGGIDRVLNP